MDFSIVNFRNQLKVCLYTNNSRYKRIKILPYYEDTYACFTSCSDFLFEDLYSMFLYGNDDDAIGAMSVIAETFPSSLLAELCEKKDNITHEKLDFLLNKVVPDYLPLFIPRNILMEYKFEDEYADDLWVKILNLLKERKLYSETLKMIQN